jgi:hypothetical protein
MTSWIFWPDCTGKSWRANGGEASGDPAQLLSLCANPRFDFVDPSINLESPKIRRSLPDIFGSRKWSSR